MNNSIAKKIDSQFKKINLNDLSQTSSDFFSNYNKIKYIKQKGGNCNCQDLFKAISNENLELILYILKEKTCCFKCQDSNGNTALHLLVSLYNNSDVKTEIDNLLSSQDCSSFINIQNDQGQTAILLAVMNDENVLAEKLENAGADGSIEDNSGNFVESQSVTVDNNLDNNLDTDMSMDLDKKKQNVINIFNLFVKNPEMSDLSTLNLNRSTDDYVDIKNNLSTDIKNDLSTDNFMEIIKKKIDGAMRDKEFKELKELNDEENSSSTTSEYLKLPESDKLRSPSYNSLNTDDFIAIIGDKGKPNSMIKLSDNPQEVDNTDDFIMILRDKYSEPKNKFINSEQATTSLNEASINTQDIKLQNEPTSDFDSVIDKLKDKVKDKEEQSKSKYNNIFLKNNNSLNNKNISTSDIDTNTLLKAINKIQSKYSNEAVDSNVLLGGAFKQKVLGYRNLNSDSDLKFTIRNKSAKLNNSTIDYNLLYNTDSEFASRTKVDELSRMMGKQKEKLHQEVLEMIMDMLNKGVLMQENKPIEASERNAKLVKAYIYRQISEKNRQMGGMDKIMLFKTMSEDEIINMVKKMPDLDELEESIKKHLEEKKKSFDASKTSEASDVSDASETSEQTESSEPEKKTKAKKTKAKEAKESKEKKSKK